MTTTTKQIPQESRSTVRVSTTRKAAKALAQAPSLVSDLAAALTAEPATVLEGRRMVQLPLDQIVPSPDNPRGEVGDVEGLAASIRSAGLLEPVIVVPAAAYRAGNDQLPDPKDEGLFILIAGHRRVAACRSLGMTHVDAIIDETKVGTAARKAMIIENFQRVDLTPLEEAKAFAELEQLGVRQDDIAAEVGCSQSHISKRLSLLRLDDQIQVAVAAKQITIGDALELVKLEENGRQVSALKAMKGDKAQGGWTRSAKQAVDEQLRRKEADEATAKAREQLKTADIAEAKNLQPLFGHDYWSYRLEADEVRKHKGRNGQHLPCLVGNINESSGSLTYYCSAKKRCSVYPSRSKDGPSKEVLEERNRKDAIKHRRSKAALLAAVPLPPSELNEFLLEQYVGHGLPRGADAATLAFEWLKANGMGGLDDVTYYNVERVLREGGDAPRKMVRYAVALRVAGLEILTADKHRSWGTDVAEYLRELVLKVGYEPNTWERTRLRTQAGIKDVDAFLVDISAARGTT